MKLLSFPALFAALCLAPAAQAAPLLLLDSANISGTAGSTIGWGFTLSSDMHYLTVANVALLPAPSIGVFNDMLALRPLFEVGPAPVPALSVMEGFDIGLGTGIGSFTIDSGAPTGAVAYATLYVVYNLYNVSPNYDPAFDPFEPLHTFQEGLVFEMPVSVTVVDPPVTGVPEPSSFGLVGGALLAGAGYQFQRRKEKGRSV